MHISQSFKKKTNPWCIFSWNWSKMIVCQPNNVFRGLFYLVVSSWRDMLFTTCFLCVVVDSRRPSARQIAYLILKITNRDPAVGTHHHVILVPHQVFWYWLHWEPSRKVRSSRKTANRLTSISLENLYRDVLVFEKAHMLLKRQWAKTI